MDLIGSPGLRSVAAVAMALLALATLALGLAPLRRRAKRRWSDVAWVLLAALALRAAFSLVQDGGGYDIFVAYRGLGDLLRSGRDVYAPPTTGLANYPPIIVWWWAAAAAAAAHGGEHLFAAIVRAPFWICDSVIAAYIVLRSNSRWGLRAGWLYALNPIAIAAPTLHGQFDSLATLPLLAAAVAVTRGQTIAGGLLMSLGVGVKVWPIYFVPHFLAKLAPRSWLRFCALSLTIPATAFLVYAAVHPDWIIAGIKVVLAYEPHRQGFGSSRLFADPAPEALTYGVNVGLGLVILLWLAWARQRDVSLFELIGISMLLLLGLSLTVSDQYLPWPLPFLLFAGRLRWAGIVTLATTPAVVFVDMWTSQGGPATPSWLLAIAALSYVVAAVVLGLEVARRSTRRSGLAAGIPVPAEAIADRLPG